MTADRQIWELKYQTVFFFFSFLFYNTGVSYGYIWWRARIYCGFSSSFNFLDFSFSFFLDWRSLSITPGDHSRHIYSRRVAGEEVKSRKDTSATGWGAISFKKKQGKTPKKSKNNVTHCLREPPSFTVGHVRLMMCPDRPPTTSS